MIFDRANGPFIDNGGPLPSHLAFIFAGGRAYRFFEAGGKTVDHRVGKAYAYAKLYIYMYIWVNIYRVVYYREGRREKKKSNFQRLTAPAR